MREGLAGKTGNLTHVSGVLENKHVVGVQTKGPVHFTLHKQVQGNENDADFLIRGTYSSWSRSSMMRGEWGGSE